MVFDELVARKYLSLKQNADNRGLTFDLSLLSIKNMMTAKRCYYTGIHLTLDKHNDKVPYNYLTIDRKTQTWGM